MGATRTFVARDKEAPNALVWFSRASRTRSALQSRTQCTRGDAVQMGHMDVSMVIAELMV